VGTLLFLLAVITYLDRVCISVAGPRIQEYLRIGPQQWGWVVGVFAIAYAAFEIPGGWMADRFGPRITLTRIVLWWSVFTSLTGAVSSFPLLLLTRFWFGGRRSRCFPQCRGQHCCMVSKWRARAGLRISLDGNADRGRA